MMQAVHWTNGDQRILKNNTCVAFFGKVRIPTIGHLTLVQEAKVLAEELDCTLHIGMSSAISEPFDIEQKKYFAEHFFQVPVQTHSNLIKFFSSISEAHDELHLVAGSDRANEYRKILTRYNGTPDSSGRILFEFKKWKVHEFKRKDVLNPKTLVERVQDVSSSKLETLIQENKYNEFKAYYPGIQPAFVHELFVEARKKNLDEGIEIPDIGHTFSRDLMPQITGDCLKDFLKYLDKKDIDYSKEKIDPSQLKSTQSDFEDLKIVSLMYNPSEEPIVVSNDDHVLDGHHRWLADFNSGKESNSIRVDLPALELYRTAKEYCSALNESINHKNFGPMVDGFVSFASEKLGIKSLPNVQLGQGEYSDQPSFASYAPDSKSIRVVTINRHPMDVLRSLAHELVHHKQNEDGRIKNIAREGSTGSPIEDEANSMAGRLMRWYAKENPAHFKLPGLTEAIFVVGTSGIETAIKALNVNENYQEINIHNLPYTEIYSDSLIIPAHIDEIRSIKKAKELLENNGFLTRLFFIKSAQKIISEGIKFTKTNKENASMKRLSELFSEEDTILIQEARRQVFTDAQRSEVYRQRREEKKTDTAIAKHLSVENRALRREVDADEHVSRPDYHPPNARTRERKNPVSKIIDLHKKGMSHRTIAKTLGVKLGSVARHVMQYKHKNKLPSETNKVFRATSLVRTPTKKEDPDKMSMSHLVNMVRIVKEGKTWVADQKAKKYGPDGKRLPGTESPSRLRFLAAEKTRRAQEVSFASGNAPIEDHEIDHHRSNWLHSATDNDGRNLKAESERAQEDVYKTMPDSWKEGGTRHIDTHIRSLSIPERAYMRHIYFNHFQTGIKDKQDAIQNKNPRKYRDAQIRIKASTREVGEHFGEIWKSAMSSSKPEDKAAFHQLAIASIGKTHRAEQRKKLGENTMHKKTLSTIMEKFKEDGEFSPSEIESAKHTKANVDLDRSGKQKEAAEKTKELMAKIQSMIGDHYADHGEHMSPETDKALSRVHRAVSGTERSSENEKKYHELEVGSTLKTVIPVLAKGKMKIRRSNNAPNKDSPVQVVGGGQGPRPWTKK